MDKETNLRKDDNDHHAGSSSASKKNDRHSYPFTSIKIEPEAPSIAAPSAVAPTATATDTSPIKMIQRRSAPIVRPRVEKTDSGQEKAVFLKCDVCGTTMDITKKQKQVVVKCTHCNEATPLRKAPLGKKYVRCPCNCLLMCRHGAHRIVCPRPNCRCVISLETSNHALLSTNPSFERVHCVHCGGTFWLNIIHEDIVRCPHCRKKSAVNRTFSRVRRFLCGGLALAFFVISCIAFAVFGSIVQGLVSLVAAFGFGARAAYYIRLKSSVIDPPTPAVHSTPTNNQPRHEAVHSMKYERTPNRKTNTEVAVH